MEVIDLLFFWISMAQGVGLSAEDVSALYTQKLDVNHRRQNDGYSTADKAEADNKSIRVPSDGAHASG